MGQELSRAGGVAILGMLVGLAPLAVGLVYALRPSERRLALMRPLTVATIFAALCTMLSGFAAVFRGISASGSLSTISYQRIAGGLSEGFTPMFVAFALLTVAWIAVAVGMRRSS
jgi:hypothetical protein